MTYLKKLSKKRKEKIKIDSDEAGPDMDENDIDQDDDPNEDDVDEDYLEKQEDEHYHNNEEDVKEDIDDDEEKNVEEVNNRVKMQREIWEDLMAQIVSLENTTHLKEVSPPTILEASCESGKGYKLI